MSTAATFLPSTIPIEQASRSHPAMRRVFPRGRLAVGLILPLETHPESPGPTMHQHASMARLAEEMGFAAFWLRDVPFYDPKYGDVGQIFEPMVYMAHLAAVTEFIALGTAGVVLPLREPKMLAKQATSVDQLSKGRPLMGLSSGDRPAEYPLFDIDFESRGERFRDAYEVFRTVSAESFPTFESVRFGHSNGTHDLIPKAHFDAIPFISIGRSQQSPDWLAKNTDGLLVPSPVSGDFDGLVMEWSSRVKAQCTPDVHKPIGIAGFLDLVDDPGHPFERIRGGFRSGSRALADFLQHAALAGVEHVAFNPKISHRPYIDVMTELAEEVFPAVPGYQKSRPFD